MFCGGIGKDFLSIITINSGWFSCMEEMIIPKVIGTVRKGFLRHFRSDRILKIANRLRSDAIEEL